MDCGLILPYLLLIMYGILRVAHGLIIDKPVSFLVVLLLMTIGSLYGKHAIGFNSLH